MSDKPYTRCVACGKPLEFDDPSMMVVEKEREVPPAFGQERDFVWDVAGAIHPDCRLPRGHRLRATAD